MRTQTLLLTSTLLLIAACGQMKNTPRTPKGISMGEVDGSAKIEDEDQTAEMCSRGLAVVNVWTDRVKNGGSIKVTGRMFMTSKVPDVKVKPYSVLGLGAKLPKAEWSKIPFANVGNTVTLAFSQSDAPDPSSTQTAPQAQLATSTSFVKHPGSSKLQTVSFSRKYQVPGVVYYADHTMPKELTVEPAVGTGAAAVTDSGIRSVALTGLHLDNQKQGILASVPIGIEPAGEEFDAALSGPVTGKLEIAIASDPNPTANQYLTTELSGYNGKMTWFARHTVKDTGQAKLEVPLTKDVVQEGNAMLLIRRRRIVQANPAGGGTFCVDAASGVATAAEIAPAPAAK